MEEAKEVLGLPLDRVPSPAELQKAYRQKALENHPDRGGDPRKMVEVNVAKEILEGKRREDFSRSPVDPEKARRAEGERKRKAALAVIDYESQTVGAAIEAAISGAEVTRGRLHLRDFFSEALAESLDEIQSQIEKSAQKDTRDWKQADALCQSISNKALRLGKKYLSLLKLHGELTAGLLGMGSSSVTYEDVSKLYAETTSFGLGIKSLYEESKKLATFINTSEDVPLEWDDVYRKTHSIILAFKDDFERFGDSGLKRLQGQLEKSLTKISSAVLEVAPDAWKKAPSWDNWRYPTDFEWARAAVRGPSKKNASTAERVARRF